LAEAVGQVPGEVELGVAAAVAVVAEQNLQSGSSEELGHTVGLEDQRMTAVAAVAEIPRAVLVGGSLYIAAASGLAQSPWVAVRMHLVEPGEVVDQTSFRIVAD
jgi:hypothetical protein